MLKGRRQGAGDRWQEAGGRSQRGRRLTCDLCEPAGSSCLTSSMLCRMRSSFWLDSERFCWASCSAFLSWLLQAVRIFSTFLDPSRQADSIFMWCRRSSIRLSRGEVWEEEVVWMRRRIGGVGVREVGSRRKGEG